MGKQWKQCLTLFSQAPKSLQMVSAAMKLKRRLLLGRKVMTNLDSILKSRTLLCQLRSKEIQPVHSEDQPWDFFGRNDAKAETPVHWIPHAKG